MRRRGERPLLGSRRTEEIAPYRTFARSVLRRFGGAARGAVDGPARGGALGGGADATVRVHHPFSVVHLHPGTHAPALRRDTHGAPPPRADLLVAARPLDVRGPAAAVR